MGARIKGLYRSMMTTRNWYSVLAVYSGLAEQVIAKLKNHTEVMVTKGTLNEYRAIRDLSYNGVDVRRSDKGDLWKLQMPDGLVFLARPLSDDFIVLSEIFFYDAYALDYDLNGKTVIDIGAGIADSSIFFASKGARVFAFEPSVGSYLIGMENVRSNNFELQIKLVNKAVTDVEKEENLMVFAGEYRNTAIMKPNGLHTSAKNGYTVQPTRTTTLATILRENSLDTVDLLKIDAEGAEFDILSASSTDALSKVRNIVLEYHRNPEQLIAFLKSLGYAVETKRYFVRRGNPERGMIKARRS